MKAVDTLRFHLSVVTRLKAVPACGESGCECNEQSKGEWLEDAKLFYCSPSDNPPHGVLPAPPQAVAPLGCALQTIMINKRGTPSRPPSSQFHRMLYRFSIAPNLQLASHAPHFMHFMLSITKGLRTCPLMAPAGQLRAHRLHPRHFSGSMA